MWPFRNKTKREPEISNLEFADMWVKSQRDAQQRFYDFLRERGSEPDDETIRLDEERVRKAEAAAYRFLLETESR